MTRLPESILRIVHSEEAQRPCSKKCKDCVCTKLTKKEIEKIVSRVSPKIGGTVWDHEKVKSDLRHDLEHLGPRYWKDEVQYELRLAVLHHDWYTD